MAQVTFKNRLQIKRMFRRMPPKGNQLAPTVKAELQRLIPPIRRLTSRDTGRLRDLVKGRVSKDGFSGSVGYAAGRGTRRIPAILEEFGGDGEPPRSRAIARTFEARRRIVTERLATKTVDVMVENARKS